MASLRKHGHALFECQEYKRVLYAVEFACTLASHPMFRTPKETTLITTDVLAPTHRVVDWFSDPIGDGMGPLNLFW